MGVLADFLTGLLRDGRAELRGPLGDLTGGPDEAADRVLAGAFAAYRLEVAGPSVELDAATARAAAERVRRACLALADRSRRAEDLAASLAMPAPPTGPSAHLSADLTLRYLPTVIRRARAFDPADELGPILEGLLRAWPLSGVLVGAEPGPERPPEFGHEGLDLLYAERWLRHNRAAWRPGASAAGGVELAGGGA